MGNSEVGHLNLGAGAIVPQDLARIDAAVRDGTLGENETLQAALRGAERVHLIGLVSTGGVHSSEEHLKALIGLAAEWNVPDLVIHAFTDGRDTSPTSGAASVAGVEAACREAGDRPRRLGRRPLLRDGPRPALGPHAAGGRPALRGHGRAPRRHGRGGGQGRLRARRDRRVHHRRRRSARRRAIRPGDAVLAFNFRPDRMRQITTKLSEVVDAYTTLTSYDEDWTSRSSSRRTARRSRSRKVIADAGRQQLHVAETEKYPHVTYFFNGGEEEPVRRRGARARAVAARRPDLRPQAGDERARGDRRVPAALGGAGLRVRDHQLRQRRHGRPHRRDRGGGHGGRDGRRVPRPGRRGRARQGRRAASSPPTTATRTRCSRRTARPTPRTRSTPCRSSSPPGADALDGEGILADVAPTALALLGIEQPEQMTGRSLLAGRAREQPQGRQRRDPEAPADGVHRRLRLGQELAGVRHDRRRVAAADQRDLQRLRAGLHADAGAARRRRARRADDRDHRRPGADGRQPPLHGRHRHRRQRDAAHPLQPARQAAHRLAPGVLLQRRLGQRRAARSRSSRAARRRRRSATLHASPAACARAARAWARSPTSTCPQLYDDSKSLNEGALTIPGYSMDGWYGRIFRGCGFFDPDKPIRKFTKKELHDLLYKEPTKIKVDGHQPDLRGPDPADPEVVPVQGRRRDAAAHPRLRGAGGDVHRPAPSAAAPGSARRPGRRRSRGSTSPTPARCRSATWPSGCAASTSRRWRRCSPRCSTRSTRSWRSGWATSRSTGRRARCRAARRSAPR